MYHRCEICWKTGWTIFFTLGEPLARCVPRPRVLAPTTKPTKQYYHRVKFRSVEKYNILKCNTLRGTISYQIWWEDLNKIYHQKLYKYFFIWIYNATVSDFKRTPGFCNENHNFDVAIVEYVGIEKMSWNLVKIHIKF